MLGVAALLDEYSLFPVIFMLSTLYTFRMELISVISNEVFFGTG